MVSRAEIKSAHEQNVPTGADLIWQISKKNNHLLRLPLQKPVVEWERRYLEHVREEGGESETVRHVPSGSIAVHLHKEQ